MGLARIPDMVWKGAEMFELTQKGDNFLLAGSSCPWNYNKKNFTAISQQSWQAQVFLKLQHRKSAAWIIWLQKTEFIA